MHQPPSGAPSGTLQTRCEFADKIFFLAFFSCLTVALGNLVIVWVDPARETVQAFNVKETFAQILWFWVVLFYWALCAWYTTRLLLEKSFAPFEYLLPCVSRGFAQYAVKWTPRLLGPAAVVPIAVLFLLNASMQELPLWLRLSPLATIIDNDVWFNDQENLDDVFIRSSGGPRQSGIGCVL